MRFPLINFHTSGVKNDRVGQSRIYDSSHVFHILDVIITKTGNIKGSDFGRKLMNLFWGMLGLRCLD